MHILYLCQYFETESDPGSGRHYYFCKFATRKDHRVTAITSNVDYKNARVRFPGKSGAISQSIGGVDIRYVYSYANFRGSFAKRFYFYLTYFYSSIAQLTKVNGFDVIYAASPPLTVGLLGLIISRLRRIPYVLEVSDVWPDAAVACGVIKNKTLITLARFLETFCYRKATQIVGLTKGICENIAAKGIDRRKVSLITNGVDFSLFNLARDDSRRLAVRKKYGIGDRFVVMYMGAHGAYNALDTIIDTAIRLNSDPRLLFVLVGNGDEKNRLQRRVTSNCLTNVVFVPSVPRLDSVALLDAADAFVLPNRKGAFFEGNLPNKLFDFMAAERPVIVAGYGESAELVAAAGCGRIGMAEDSSVMAQSLVEILDMPFMERMSMGERGKNYIIANYDRIKLSEKLLKIIEDVKRNQP